MATGEIVYASWVIDLMPLRTAGEISNAFMCSPKTCWKFRTACSITALQGSARSVTTLIVFQSSKLTLTENLCLFFPDLPSLD